MLSCALPVPSRVQSFPACARRVCSVLLCLPCKPYLRYPAGLLHTLVLHTLDLCTR